MEQKFLHLIFYLLLIFCLFTPSSIWGQYPLQDKDDVGFLSKAVDKTSPVLHTNQENFAYSKMGMGNYPDDYLVKVMPEDRMGKMHTVVSSGFTVSTCEPVLELSPSVFDFGSKYVVKKLDIRNSGTCVLHWVISAQEEWISVEQGTGSTNEKKTDEINILVDRSLVETLGTYGGDGDELSITSDGGKANVGVIMERINHPPEVPLAVSPADFATDQSLYSSLNWQGGDMDTKDGDVVTYDVYFSANETLVDIEDDSVLTCSKKGCYCDPATGGLEFNTTYYWKVVAKDRYGEVTSGSVWNFTTKEKSNTLCPTFALALGDEERMLLRAFRDRVLLKDKNGKEYIKLYYHYAGEILLILLFHNELRVESMKLFGKLLPVLMELLNKGKTMVSLELVEETRGLLGRIALHASPALMQVLECVQADIKSRKNLGTLGVTLRD